MHYPPLHRLVTRLGDGVINVSNVIVSISEALGGVAGLAGLGVALRRGATEKAQAAAKERAVFGQAQFDAGAHSRDDEIRQMKSERDDARHERDEKTRSSDMWQQRYLDQLNNKGKPND